MGNNSVWSLRDKTNCRYVRSVDDTRVTPFFVIEIVLIWAGSRILPRKRRHFRSPPGHEIVGYLSSGTVELTLTEQGPQFLLALLSARQHRDDAPCRVARSAVDTEELLMKGWELEMRLRSLEFCQCVHVQQRDLP